MLCTGKYPGDSVKTLVLTNGLLLAEIATVRGALDTTDAVGGVRERAASAGGANSRAGDRAGGDANGCADLSGWDAYPSTRDGHTNGCTDRSGCGARDGDATADRATSADIRANVGGCHV
jgi:hypothetical protein